MENDAINWKGIEWFPLGERIVIRRRTLQDTVRKSGIMIKNKDMDHSSKLNEGVLLLLGEKVNHPKLQPGIPVQWGKHAGFEWEKDKEVFIMMNVGDLVRFGKEDTANGSK